MAERDDIFEKRISPLIESQFPLFYQEEGPLFVAFVKQYYKWLEQANNTLYHTRRIPEYKDVDATVDEFLIYFKEKYLKNIQFDTAADTRLLIKHSLDLYRSKGTERSIDLLFRAVFGVGAEVYYPADDLFRTSAAKYILPKYLEVSLKETNKNFINKQIVGQKSGASAFVEAVVRKIVNGRIIDVMFITGIRGVFETGETINTSTNDFKVGDIPTIVGSMTSLTPLSATTQGSFQVGDVVDVISSRYGVQGKARITGVTDVSGSVNLELIDGGWGYSENAQVLISEKVIKVENVQIDANNDANSYFYLFDQVFQPLANINFVSANGTFANGDEIFTYDVDDNVVGHGRILVASHDGTDPTSGELMVSVLSGNLEDTFYTTGNTVTAELDVTNGYFDWTATGNVIGWYSNVDITVIDVVGDFQRDETVVQENANGVVLAKGTLFSMSGGLGGSPYTFRIIDSHGIYHNDLQIRGLSSNAVGNVQASAIWLGLIDVANSFSIVDNNYFYGSNSSTTGTVTLVGQGSGANLGISNSLIHTETVEFNTDFIAPYLDLNLEDEWEFPSGNANLDSIIDDVLTYEEITVGTITALTGIAPGSDYSLAPVINIYEPLTYPFQNRDLVMSISGIDGSFSVGEMITQDATGAQGIIKFANTSLLKVRRAYVYDEKSFIPTSNSTTIILGDSSAATANIESVWIDPDEHSVMGYNAEVGTGLQVSNGAVSNVVVVVSGFAYDNNEEVRLVLGNNEVTARVSLETHGQGEGYFRDRVGFTSSDSRLHDGYYWQEFSYEVRSPLPLSKYADMLREIVHVAGTKAFGSVYHKGIAQTTITVTSSIELGEAD